MTYKTVPKTLRYAPFGPSCWSPWWKKRPGFCLDDQKSAPGLEILRKSYEHLPRSLPAPEKKGHNLPLGPLRFAFKTAARVRQSAGGCRNERRSQVGQNKKEIARNRTKLCHHHPTSVWPCALAVLRCAYSCLKNVTAQNRGRRCAPPRGIQ